MNVSKNEQRVLHTLAQGGHIRHFRNGRHILAAQCVTREGYLLAGFSLETFARLKRRGLIQSRSGQPYRISAKGLGAVRAQLDNR